ncbi:MAG: GNAT family N-acetyltransferase [Clostridium sp.]|jgi:N-acetylglutamate synthase-like GNAT family acetyltransferase|nr:GNAT family N-acetyltransferase [Clostridium sp.]
MGIKLRTAVPSDAPQIKHLVCLQYGEGNADRTLYDAEALAEKMNRGIYRFFVAEEEGKLVGMVCRKRGEDFGGSVEGCTLSVLPRYRGDRIGVSLMSAMKRDCVRSGIPALYYQVLTLNEIVQRREYADGFVPCALILNRYRYDRTAVNLRHIPLPERRHHLLMVKAIRQKKVYRLFFPKILEDYIFGVYVELGVSVGGEVCGVKRGVVVHDYPSHDYADFLGGLPQSLPGRESVNLWLNMYQKDCGEQYERAVEAGFSFTGVEPLAGDGEYLILHRSPSAPAAFSQSRTIREFDERKNFLRRCGNVSIY